MLSQLRKTKETGFTLIELLTVIIIIGILAAIAIPVFSAQRSRAQDSQTISDVRNAATFAETYLANKDNRVQDLSQASIEYVSSKNVKWDIKGYASTGGYCIVAFNSSGKTYNSDQKLLSYDSTAGGLKGSDGSCGKKEADGSMKAGSVRTGDETKANNDPTKIVTATPSNSTSVGSDTVTAPVNSTPVVATNTNSGATGTLQTFSVPATGVYKIEAWGASGGIAAGFDGGLGAYSSGIVSLTAGQQLSLLLGQKGTDGSSNSGGGGGTFVVTGATNSGTALVVAGGGGGTYNGVVGKNGSITTSGGAGRTDAAPGINGAGGTAASGQAGAGGGFLSAGTPASGITQGGGAYPGNGGTGNYSAGGYGGGGTGSGAADGGGAGGGYSGGAPGNGAVSAGGGGSYVIGSYNGSAVTSVEVNNTTKANLGNGKVTITRIS